MNIIINLILSGVAVFVAGYILPGVHIENFTAALVMAVVLGVINAFLRPIILILTLPVNLMTLGLFTFVINALLVLLADKFVDGFSIDGFLWALILSVVLTLINSFLHKLTPKPSI